MHIYKIVLIVITAIILLLNLIVEPDGKEENINRIKINILFLMYLVYLVLS